MSDGSADGEGTTRRVQKYLDGGEQLLFFR